jgi:hypothetical protein
MTKRRFEPRNILMKDGRPNHFTIRTLSNRQKYCHFKISLLYLSKSNDNFGCGFDNSKMRELSKKSTIYMSNLQVTFQIDWISISEIVKLKVKLVNCF